MLLVTGNAVVPEEAYAYGELLGNLGQSVTASAVRDLELGVVLNRQELGLAVVEGGREAGGGEGEENGDLGEVHVVGLVVVVVGLTKGVGVVRYESNIYRFRYWPARNERNSTAVDNEGKDINKIG